MKRLWLLVLSLLLPVVALAQDPIQARGQQAIALLSAAIQQMQAEARICSRAHSEQYCAVLEGQIALFLAHRTALCSQYKIPKGEEGCL